MGVVEGGERPTQSPYTHASQSAAWKRPMAPREPALARPDPCPLTLARPDPIDMDEDEKEMLSEAPQPSPP